MQFYVDFHRWIWMNQTTIWFNYIEFWSINFKLELLLYWILWNILVPLIGLLLLFKSVNDLFMRNWSLFVRGKMLTFFDIIIHI